MFTVILFGKEITPGIIIDFEEMDNFNFKVLTIAKEYFEVRWLSGPRAEMKGVVPYSLFGEHIQVSEISPDNPNQAFKLKKLKHDDYF